MLLKLQDNVCKESQDNNTCEAKKIIKIVEPKKLASIKVWLLGGFMRWVENFVFVGWSIGI